MRKKPTISKNSIVLVFFKSDRPVCNHIYVNFMKTSLRTIFSLKKSRFCILNPKNFEFKKTVQNTAKRLPIKIHIYRQKSFQFYFISIWTEITSLKSDQLELGFSKGRCSSKSDELRNINSIR